MKERCLFFGFLFVFFIFGIGLVSANFLFNGSAYDVNGTALNNVTINVTIYNVSGGFNVVTYNSTLSNASGWFNMSINDTTNFLYQIVITHTNTTFNFTDFIGQTLPAFPSFMISQLSNTIFYLKPAGTINITVINSSGSANGFNYQIKDTKLGYPVVQSMGSANTVTMAVVSVPSDRNYSIMVYPNRSMPVSFSWNNFSAGSSYVIGNSTLGTNLSLFNTTTVTLHKKFNDTEQMLRVTGYVNTTNVANFSGWNELGVVAYIVEPGNMVHSQGFMPYNMSSFSQSTDVYNLTSGFYNISLPAPAESAQILLFATGRNTTTYYGGFRSINLTYGGSVAQTNFTLYGLLGVYSNITLNDAGNWSSLKNISTQMQIFQLVNSTNQSLSQANGHIEVGVDYTNYGAFKFNWMMDVAQSGSSNFSVPLLNITNPQEVNIFVGGGNYAPKKISPTIASLINNNNANGNKSNISIGSFNPQAIDASIASSGISMSLFISNSTCDVPSPSQSCFVGGSGSSGNKTMDNFNPMSAIMGGGKLSFRMGSGGIQVHYVNVDMLASGPPDALFDSSASNSNGNGFGSAMRFGSSGPSIYDYVLVSMPYATTSGSGLDSSKSVNFSISTYYDDNWNVIWNTSLNGTNTAAFANNFSHYSARQSEWAYLMNQTVCITNSSAINVSQPCYIDTAANEIWLRIPHFSGAGPTILGSVVATSTSSTSSSGGGGGGSIITSAVTWKATTTISPYQFIQGYSADIGSNERVQFSIAGENHSVGVLNVSSDKILVSISSTPQQKTMSVGEEAKFDITNDNVYDVSVKLVKIENGKATLIVKFISEKISSVTSSNNGSTNNGELPANGGASPNVPESQRNKSNWIFVFIIIIILIVVFLLYKKIAKHRY